MKKGVLIVLLLALVSLLFLSNFVVAQIHSICDPTGEANIHGVEIDGVCYNCDPDTSDLVCPDDYGANCLPLGGDIDCEYLPLAFWSINDVVPSLASQNQDVILPEGKDFYLVVQNVAGEDGTSVTFDIKEKAILIDPVLKTVYATQNSGQAIATWHASQEDLNNMANVENRLYFVASSDEWVDMDSTAEPASLLNITWTYTGPVITDCSDYTNVTECAADPVGVGIGPLTREEDGCIFDLAWNCAWINNTGCRLASNETYIGDDPTCEGKLRPTCVYDIADSQGDCDAGDDFFKITYSSVQEECETWITRPIPCPAQVRLPFFGFFNIIASLSIISIIYAFLFKRR